METQKYTRTAVIIHWIMAIMIIAMIGLGLYMTGLDKGSDERSWFFRLHKSMGLTLALLAIMRLGWKMYSPSPALPDYVTPIDRKLATATHHLLYLVMFIQPISGYISASFSGYKTKFWGIPLPHWGSKQPELNQLFTDIHDVSAICLVTLLLLHFAGVIYHLHKKETNLIKRMWFS